jgi:hypothetical protein
MAVQDITAVRLCMDTEAISTLLTTLVDPAINNISSCGYMHIYLRASYWTE